VRQNLLRLKVLISLFLFDGHPDWIESNYVQFLKPAVARGNVVGVLIGNEDPDMLAAIIQYLQKAKQDFPQTPVSTAQTTGFWLTDPRASQVLPLVDFVAVNIYPEWNWASPNAANQPVNSGQSVTPEQGFASFQQTYNQVANKYAGKAVVVTETGWPTTYGCVAGADACGASVPPPTQFPDGIANARKYLNLVKGWAQDPARLVNVYFHNMFDDLHAVNTSSLFNYHFGLIDHSGRAKGVLF